jgi:hypothetical protein
MPLVLLNLLRQNREQLLQRHSLRPGSRFRFPAACPSSSPSFVRYLTVTWRKLVGQTGFGLSLDYGLLTHNAYFRTYFCGSGSTKTEKTAGCSKTCVHKVFYLLVLLFDDTPLVGTASGSSGYGSKQQKQFWVLNVQVLARRSVTFII